MIVRLYAGEDGQSHFEDFSLPLADDRSGERPPVYETAGLRFARYPVGLRLDWHNPPRRRHVFVLAGQIEFGIGDGTVRRFGPGDMVIAEDLTGQGHTARIVGDHPLLLAYVYA